MQQGGPTSVGKGKGEGFNINIGWNDKKMGDDEYLVVWEKLLMPVATEFGPDLVIVSAGFDAAQGGKFNFVYSYHSIYYYHNLYTCLQFSIWNNLPWQLGLLENRGEVRNNCNCLRNREQRLMQ